jgi:hypothetical protein
MVSLRIDNVMVVPYNSNDPNVTPVCRLLTEFRSGSRTGVVGSSETGGPSQGSGAARAGRSPR